MPKKFGSFFFKTFLDSSSKKIQRKKPSFQIEQQEGLLVVLFEPEFLATKKLKLFKQELQNDIFYEIGHSQKVVFDLQNVQTLEVQGISLLLFGASQMKAVQGKFGICNISPSLRPLLESIRLHLILYIFKDQQEAISFFNTSNSES